MLEFVSSAGMKLFGNRSWQLISCAWVITIAVAFAVDARTAMWMHVHCEPFLHTHQLLRELLKSPGEFSCALLIALLAACLHRARWQASALILLAAALSG